MRNILIICFVALVLVGCETTSSRVQDKDLQCAWNSQHKVCFCWLKAGYGLGLTYVPDKVCGK